MALDETSMRVEGPDRAVNGSGFLGYGDRAREREAVGIVSGEVRLHNATLGSRRGTDYSTLDGKHNTRKEH
jgi:hypothetical protein